MSAIGDWLADLAKGIIRTSSFFFKEIWAALRQPRLIFSVLLGPFLILAAFGIGYRGQTPELSTLLGKFQGQWPVALAAYNAGPGAATRWLPARPMDADVWIENIPYNETRTYVQRVLWHSVVFGWLESGKAQSTKTLLDKVKP